MVNAKNGGMIKIGKMVVYSPLELYKIERVYQTFKYKIPGLCRQDLKDLLKNKKLNDKHKLKKLQFITGGILKRGKKSSIVK